jgi:phosphate:Na+ symporter
LPLRQALIVLAWSNIGTAVLVFIAALDLHLPILYVIGISGLLLAFKLAKNPAIAGLLSVGLVFFGLEMMKQAFNPVASTTGFAVVARFFARWPYSAFLLGAVLRSFIHSSSSVAAIAITINKGGQLGEFPAMMVIAGLGLGTALASYMLSSNLRGAPRQIAMYQALTNTTAGFVIAALLVLERVTDAPVDCRAASGEWVDFRAHGQHVPGVQPHHHGHSDAGSALGTAVAGKDLPPDS